MKDVDSACVWATVMLCVRGSGYSYSRMCCGDCVVVSFPTMWFTRARSLFCNCLLPPAACAVTDAYISHVCTCRKLVLTLEGQLSTMPGLCSRALSLASIKRCIIRGSLARVIEFT